MYFDFSKVKDTPRQRKLAELQRRFYFPTYRDNRRRFTCVYIDTSQGRAKERRISVLAYNKNHAYLLGQIYGSVVCILD